MSICTLLDGIQRFGIERDVMTKYESTRMSEENNEISWTRRGSVRNREHCNLDGYLGPRTSIYLDGEIAKLRAS
jgi:hypothetical protein